MFCASSHPGTPVYQCLRPQHCPVPHLEGQSPGLSHHAIQFRPALSRPLSAACTISSATGSTRVASTEIPVTGVQWEAAKCPHWFPGPAGKSAASSHPGTHCSPSTFLQQLPVPQNGQGPPVLLQKPQQALP